MIIQNVKLVSMLLAIVSGLQIINIVLGSLDAMIGKSFDWRKFFLGIIKALVNSLCIIGTCALADLFAQVLNMIEGLNISAQIVSTMEILAVIVVWALDLFKDILDKIQKLKTLKYVSYEDVKYNDGNGTSL